MKKWSSNDGIIKGFVLTLSLVVLSGSLFAQGGQRSELQSFDIDTAQGVITFKVYIPSSYSGEKVPLVVVLHGCSQSVEEIAIGSRWNELAEKECFIVLYPQQSKSRNSYGCWNWFLESNQHRGRGEPFMIAEATHFAITQWNIDSSKVYICGMSAGASMALITAICYPDIFSSVGSHSGLEYGAATSVSDAFWAMENGGPDPVTAGERAYNEILASNAHRSNLPAIVFHGTHDDTVNSINGDQTVQQFVATNDLLDNGRLDGSVRADPEINGFEGKPYKLIRYKDSAGNIVVEYWIVEGLNHAWSGGSEEGGKYNDPIAPNATLYMWNFFNHVGP